MPLEVAIMIEGQEGLTWERWAAIARATEDGGFDALFRSDHVCPLTFYHPALLAKRAAAVDQLANGRLDLGIGAGWHEGEHRTFGIPFPPLKERIDRLECGARAIRALWEGRPVTLAQPYYPLEAAQSAPRPVNGALRLIVGGKGERRVLKIVAEHADEWNVTRVTRDEFRAKTEVLAQHCRAAGRDPGAIRRSLMVPIIVGRSADEIDRRRARARTLFPRVPDDAAGWRAAGFLYGAPAEIAGELRAWQTAGMSRVMLQLLDMDDLDAIALIAGEILPALRSAQETVKPDAARWHVVVKTTAREAAWSWTEGTRAGKLLRFLAQPFFIAEPYTKRPGTFVPRAAALATCRAILDGAYDDLPDDAFYFVGGIDEVLARAGRAP